MSALYVELMDEIVVRAQTRVTGVTLALTAYQATGEGQRLVAYHLMSLSGAGLINTFRFRPGRTLLETCQLGIYSGTVRRGQVAAVVSVERSSGSDAFHGAASGVVYPSTNAPVQASFGDASSGGDGGWYPLAISGTDPGPGAEIVETVPVGVEWDYQHLFTTFVADAAVANRRPLLILDDGTNIYYSVPVSSDITAGQTRIILHGDYGQIPGITQDRSFLGLPGSLRLQAGWRIRTATVNLQAGDDYQTPRVLVRERLTLVGY